MAHEIQQTDYTAFALKPAWHGLGEVFDHAPTSDELKVRLGYRNELAPVYTVLEREGQTIRHTLPDYAAVVRRDTNKPIAVVGSRYKLVQNSEVFDLLDRLHSNGTIVYESAGTLKGGRIFWALARLPSQDYTATIGDDLRSYILFQTSHDGSMRMTGTPTLVRVVCWNTLTLAISKGQQMLRFKHSGNIKLKLDYMSKWLAQFDRKFDDYRFGITRLVNTKWTKASVTEYIDKLFPKPDDPLSKAATIRNDKVADIRRRWNSDTNTTAKGTWWQVFNVITEFADHSSLNKYKGSDRDRAESRFMNLTTGKQSEFKARAFDLALQLAI